MQRKYIKVNIDELSEYKYNNKKHTDKDISEIVKSIQKCTYISPICVDENLQIINGHGRKEALKRLGNKEVEVLQIIGLSEEQKRKARLLDNKTTNIAELNIENIKFELDELQDIELNELFIDIEGLDIDEPEAKEDNYEAPAEIKTDIKRGDLITFEKDGKELHRLHCGDSTSKEDVERLMNGEKADMVFTDPPYGMFFDTDYTKMPTSPTGAKPLKHNTIIGDKEDFNPLFIKLIFQIFGYIKEVFLWGADYYSEHIVDKNKGSWIVWDKRVEENFDKMIGSAFELCRSKQKHKREIARVNNTLYSGESDAINKVHPTQKPIKLCNFFLDRYSKENEIVIDLFGGSGSTMVACHQLNRRCYMQELDERYCEVIKQRMQKLDPTITIKKNGVLIS